jgi:hypothetical protein
LPVLAFHTLAVPSSLPLTMRSPSGLIATLVTKSLCPLRVTSSLPDCPSQTFSVVSSLPLTMRF